MARKGARTPLAVYLNGRRVGRFRRERTGAVDFRYAQEWLDWDNASPVSLSMPLREDRYIGDPVFAVFDKTSFRIATTFAVVWQSGQERKATISGRRSKRAVLQDGPLCLSTAARQLERDPWVSFD
jgi:hypothetical protein